MCSLTLVRGNIEYLLFLLLFHFLSFSLSFFFPFSLIRIIFRFSTARVSPRERDPNTLHLPGSVSNVDVPLFWPSIISRRFPAGQKCTQLPGDSPADVRDHRYHVQVPGSFRFWKWVLIAPEAKGMESYDGISAIFAGTFQMFLSNFSARWTCATCAWSRQVIR